MFVGTPLSFGVTTYPMHVHRYHFATFESLSQNANVGVHVPMEALNPWRTAHACASTHMHEYQLVLRGYLVK
jgi:hypothetical protein